MFVIWKSGEENRPRLHPRILWFALLGRSFIYLQQKPFSLISSRCMLRADLSAPKIQESWTFPAPFPPVSMNTEGFI